MASYKKIFIVFLLMIFLPLVLVNFSLSAERELEVPIPGLKTTTLPALPDYIIAIYNFALMIIGIICFGALLYGGFRYLTSAGKPAAMADAKDQIFSALLGLIILFSSYLILTTINPELVIFIEPGKEPVGGECISTTDCPEDLVCVGGFCVLPGGGWTTGCSSYIISTECTNAGCDWCPVCSGNLINSWKTDKCVDTGTDCGYVCVVGECGAASCE